MAANLRPVGSSVVTLFMGVKQTGWCETISSAPKSAASATTPSRDVERDEDARHLRRRVAAEEARVVKIELGVQRGPLSREKRVCL